MRVVFDTNVLVSAMVASGVTRRLFDSWREDRTFDLIVCPLLLGELSEVLQRPRFRSVMAIEDVVALVTFLRNEAVLVDDPSDIPALSSDPDDDYLVALALRERVDAVVSGDRDLIQLNRSEFVVLRPAEALARFSSPR